jgi:hypothetical protein
MFEIAVLPSSERGEDGQRLGRITIGDFSERFGCYGSAAQIGRMDSTWRARLQAIVDGALVVALIHDPRFAWVVFRDGESCFVQQVGSPNGKFGAPRRHRGASEWETTVAAIRGFLQRGSRDVA